MSSGIKQAARDNRPTFYTWNDPDTDAAKVYNSEEEAKRAWDDAGMGNIHAGFVVDISFAEWI